MKKTFDLCADLYVHLKENMWRSPFVLHISAFFLIKEKTKFVLVEVQSNAAAPAANKRTQPTR
jgi:hypothetical protein